MERKVGTYKSSWEMIMEFFNNGLLLGEKALKKGYYYTTIETLDKILISGALYSTNYRYLNDPSEWQYGYNRIKTECQLVAEQYEKDSGENTKKKDFVRFMRENIFKAQHYLNDYPIYNSNIFRGNYSEIFTISFTEEEDLISQWERYAKESGVVIELDFSAFLKKRICFYQQTLKKVKIPVEIAPQKVAYKENDIKKISRESMKTMFNNFVKRTLTEERLSPYFHMFVRYVASYIKNLAYEQEKEIRISCYPLINEATKVEEIDSSEMIYTIQEGVMIPHVPLYCGIKKGEDLEDCGYPIRSIRVGPGYNQDSVYQSLIHRMECGEKKIYLLSEVEQIEVKNRYILEGLANYAKIAFYKSKSNKATLELVLSKLNDAEHEELKNAIEEIYNKSKKENLRDVFNELQELKQKFYEQVFKDFEKDQFCTSQGILIKKSEIPYLFSKR